MSSVGFVTTAAMETKFGWQCWPSEGPQYESCQVTKVETLVNYYYLILSLLILFLAAQLDIRFLLLHHKLRRTCTWDSILDTLLLKESRAR